MNELQEEELNAIKIIHPFADSLLEVGCGDGNFLVHAKRYFKRCIGIEPESSFLPLYEQNNLCVIEDYLKRETRLDEKLDVICI